MKIKSFGNQKNYEDEYILGPGDLVQILIPSMSGDSLKEIKV